MHFLSNSDSKNKETVELPRGSFEQKVEELKPTKLTENSQGYLGFSTDTANYYTIVKTGSTVGYDIASSHNIKYTYTEPSKIGGAILKTLMFLGIGLLLVFLLTRRSGNAQAVQKMVLKRPGMRDIPSISFDDIGGLHTESKQHILQSLELFKKPQLAKKLNVKPVKHILLHGPPGTGKTQIAKAIANHLGVPFFSQSGSSFVQLYVGAGALRVRELFDEAKKNAPCVIFIDEIDGLAAKRGAPNRSEECDRTLNEFLVHMNGIDESDRILIVGATNMLGMLDEAVLRPGRFDHKICIDLPDAKGRQEIIEIHAKGKPFTPEAKKGLSEFAFSLTGFSGADIEGLINRAAEHCLIENRSKISQEDLDYALDYAVLGSKGSELSNIEVKRRVAYHEAGHALVQSLIGPGKIRKATVLPRGKALGFVAPIPDESPLYTQDDFFDRLHVALAGGVAETYKYGKHSNGVSGDLKQATQLIEMMIEAGMGTDSFKVFFDDNDKNKLKEELFDKALLRTTTLISEHATKLELLTEQLMTQDSLTGDEIDRIVHGLTPDTSPSLNREDDSNSFYKELVSFKGRSKKMAT